MTLALGKGDLRHSNLWGKKKKKEKKRQRNIEQIKEQGRNSKDQINKEKIGKLPEREYGVIIVKVIQNLEKRMEKMQESINIFNENAEEIKKKKKTNKTITPIKNTQPTPVLLSGKSHGQRSLARSQIRLRDFTFSFHFHALQKEMATYSSVLAWRIPGMEEPGGLLSLGSHRVRHD